MLYIILHSHGGGGIDKDGSTYVHVVTVSCSADAIILYRIIYLHRAVILVIARFFFDFEDTDT